MPNLDAATRARPQLCAHASAAVLACAKRLDAADFRTTLQPLLERFLGDEKTPPAALHAVVSHAGLLLERADAAWAATRVTDALCRALREASGAALVDAALAQLGDGDTLDALVAKSSLAGPGGACGKLSGELVPAVCRVAVAATSPLGCKVRAHKALAACLERPAATPPDVVSGVCVPALHASVKKVDGHPALAMCVLGCYDVVAKRLPERSRITRDVLPALVPLLCGTQIFNPTSMCALSNGSDQPLQPCFENSTRAIDSSKNQPNRLRFDRAREFSSLVRTTQTSG